jgi:oligopeptide transport system substrate-binding protein
MRSSSLLLTLLGFVLASAACAKRESVVERGNRESVLHLSIGSEPSDLDPHIVVNLADAKVIQSLFEPLVTFEPGTLAPKPALAERWEISTDGLTYTFHLRPDAKWSNGEAVVAQDCVDSWRRILTPSLGANYAYFLYLLRGAEAFHQGHTKDFSTVGVAATDIRTLVVTLTHPAAYFLQVLLNTPWRPINVRSIAGIGDPSQRGTPWTRPGRLVSSGPFVLKEWNAHQRIVVEKSPTFTTATASASTPSIFIRSTASTPRNAPTAPVSFTAPGPCRSPRSSPFSASIHPPSASTRMSKRCSSA